MGQRDRSLQIEEIRLVDDDDRAELLRTRSSAKDPLLNKAWVGTTIGDIVVELHDRRSSLVSSFSGVNGSPLRTALYSGE